MTIKEIAKLADVSVGTVSYVINNKGRLSQNVRERVMTIMEQNGYVPNSNARNLVKRKSKKIGIMIPDTEYLKSSLFFTNIASGILKEISGFGYDLSIQTKEDSYERWIKNSNGVDGLIIINPENNEEYISWLKASKIPYTAIGRIDEDVYAVDGDIVNIAYTLTKLFLDNGHKKILFRLGHKEYTYTEDIILGIKKAYEEKEIDLLNCKFRYEEFVIDESEIGFMKDLESDKEITAIISSSEAQTIATKEVLNKYNFKIPGDYSIGCLSSSTIIKYSTPKITSCTYDSEEFGKLTARKLIDVLENKTENKKEYEVLPFTLEIGETLKNIKE